MVEEYADRGAVFIAVNQRQKAETISAFLKEKQLEHLAVALDTDGSVSNAYGVSGIPHTAILDREGVVRAVHVGYGPGSEEQVRNDIETILAEEAQAQK